MPLLLSSWAATLLSSLRATPLEKGETDCREGDASFTDRGCGSSLIVLVDQIQVKKKNEKVASKDFDEHIFHLLCKKHMLSVKFGVYKFSSIKSGQNAAKERCNTEGEPSVTWTVLEGSELGI